MEDEFSKGGLYHDTWKKMYKFHKTFAITTTDEDWNKLVDHMECANSQFERELCIAIVNEIERIYKDRVESN